MDLSKVIGYFEKFSKQSYIAPEKTSGAEREFYLAFKEAGHTAREEYKAFCERVCHGIPELVMDSKSPSSWINQGQVAEDYFWSRFRTRSHDGFVHNIAVTMNRILDPSGFWVLGVYVSPIYNDLGGKECIRHNRVLDLDIPVSEDFYYVVRTTNEAEYLSKDRDEVRKRFDEGRAMVVSLLKIIPGPYTADRTDELIEKTREAVRSFIPYYEYVLSGDRAEKAWKTVAPKKVEPEVPRVDWEKEFPVGCQVEHAKFLSGVVQAIGNETITICFEDFGVKELRKDACAAGGLLERV